MDQVLILEYGAVCVQKEERWLTTDNNAYDTMLMMMPLNAPLNNLYDYSEVNNW